MCEYTSSNVGLMTSVTNFFFNFPMKSTAFTSKVHISFQNVSLLFHNGPKKSPNLPLVVLEEKKSLNLATKLPTCQQCGGETGCDSDSLLPLEVWCGITR